MEPVSVYYARVYTKDFKPGYGPAAQAGQIELHGGPSTMFPKGKRCKWPPDYCEKTGIIYIESYLSQKHAMFLARKAYEMWNSSRR